MLGLGKEVRALTGLKSILAHHAGGQQFGAAGAELSVQAGDKRHGLRGEDLRHLWRDDLQDLDAFRKLLIGHWSSVTVYSGIDAPDGANAEPYPHRCTVRHGQSNWMTTLRASPVRARRNASSTWPKGT